MFTPSTIEKIQIMYEERLTSQVFFAHQMKHFQPKFLTLALEETICLKYLYSHMPFSDIGEYSFEQIYGFVSHSIYLRKHIPWCAALKDEYFLAYVLFYRINDEDISDHRKYFFQHLYPRIQNLPLEKAILEINIWCCENVTYRSTDDRTASPLTVFHRAYGRCGEESTFMVAALRSVGIAARQIYAPRWSHCDDNHAWVEVYIQPNWHFTGACEPEPILNRGWFNAAAARAMLIHYRRFGDILDPSPNLSALSQQKDITTTINQLPIYAPTSNIKLKIADENHIPLPGISVVLQIVNYAQLYPLFAFTTPETGEIHFQTNHGSLLVCLTKNGQSEEHFISTEEQTDFCLVFPSQSAGESSQSLAKDLDFMAPSNETKPAPVLDITQQKNKKETLTTCGNIRRQKEAHLLFSSLPIIGLEQPQERIDSLLFLAKHNHTVIRLFLQHHPTILTLQFLESLTEKDLTDITVESLEDHFQYGKVSATFPPEILIPYLLCPRIHLEYLRAHRKFIQNYFTPEQKNKFFKQPSSIWQYIKDHIIHVPQQEYCGLITSPITALKHQQSSPLSQKILFVAIARAIGIPARLHPQTLEPEYYQQNCFIPVVGEIYSSHVILDPQVDTNWIYGTNWSVAKVENGHYQTLLFQGSVEDFNQVSLPQGDYRLLSSNRLPNGNCLLRLIPFHLKPQSTLSLALTLRTADFSSLLQSIPLAPFTITDKNQQPISLNQIANKTKNIILWLKENEEPSVHILNELLSQAKAFHNLSGTIIFIAPDFQTYTNPLLEETLKMIPQIQTYIDPDFDSAVAVARSMFVDPDKLPLVLVCDQNSRGIYAFSGYNVGLSHMLLKIDKI